MTVDPLDPFSEVVDERRRWTPDWYSWLRQLADSIPPEVSGGSTPSNTVNVKDFGATGDGNTDDTQSLQDAIDYAFTNHIQDIYVPAGRYRTTRTLWLDFPGNLRGTYPDWSSGTTYAAGDLVSHNGQPWLSIVNSNLGNEPALNGTNFSATGDWSRSNSDATGKFVFWAPTIAPPSFGGQANICFRGDPAQGRTDGWGSIILTNFNNAAGVILGPGDGQAIRSIAIYGGGGWRNDATDGGTVNGSVWPPAYRLGRGLPTLGVGLMLAGAPSGSRQFIEKVATQAWYYGIQTGGNGDGLGDFNIFRDLFVYNSAVGLSFSQTQNFINEVYDSNISARILISAPAGTGCRVTGGNYTTMDEQSPSCLFTVGSVTIIDAVTFSVVIATSPAPDPNNYGGNDMFDLLKTGQFTIFAVRTAHFGIIPTKPVSYEVSTRKLTLELANNWDEFYKYQPDLSATFDLAADILATTELWAAEETICFQGGGIHVKNIHQENICVTTFFDTTYGFGQTLTDSAQGVQFNSALGYSVGAYDNRAKANLTCQYCVPVFRVANGSLEIRDCAINMTSQHYKLHQRTQNDFFIYNSPGFNIEQRVAGIEDNNVQLNGVYQGAGRYEQWPVFSYGPYPGGSHQSNYQWWRMVAKGAYHGFWPAPWTRPLITSFQFDAITGTLTPPSTDGGGNWHIGIPPLLGGQIYSVHDFDGNWSHKAARVEFMSDHRGYSYGVDFPINWSCKGHSNVIVVDDVGPFFQGMVIGITTDAFNGCLVTGVFTDQMFTNVPPWAGHIEVIVIAGGSSNFISGVSTTVYTGATITQDKFDFHYIDAIPSARLVGDLPSAASRQGARAIVTDATATTFWTVVAGGGGNTVPVTSDGTDWRIG